MRVIADHLRGAVFLAVDGVLPSNKEQGYVMRRLIRRAIRFALDLGIDQKLCESLVPVITKIYGADFSEVSSNKDQVLDILNKEEALFRKTLTAGVRELSKFTKISGQDVFKLYDTYGFPVELTIEEASLSGIKLADDWKQQFSQLMEDQRNRSRTATKGEFKGGMANHSEITTKYHTATHLMYRALRMVLGDHVIQRGSNITEERLRFDFSHPQKMTDEEIKKVEEIVNKQIKLDLPVSWREEKTKDALTSGVMGAFGDKYGDSVKVYTVGDPGGENFSREICGGPHVEHTGQLGEGGMKFRIQKEESSSSGVRRIKAILIKE
jgi:alanyl-tRNA synthetase